MGHLVSSEKESMAQKDGKRSWVMVNRAPVLTLWAAVVAEVLGGAAKKECSPDKDDETWNEYIHTAGSGQD